MDYTEKLISQQKYIFDYFKAHASQRLTTFNFYIIFFTFCLTAYSYSYSIHTTEGQAIRFAISLILIMLSLTFLFLDNRCKNMIKISECALKKLEPLITPEFVFASIHIFTYEERKTNRLKHKYKKGCKFAFWKQHYSYYDCFRTIFCIGIILGMIGITLGIKCIIFTTT